MYHYHNVHVITQRVFLINLCRCILADLLLILLDSVVDCLLHDVEVLLPGANLQRWLIHGIETLQEKPLERLLVLALIFSTIRQLLLSVLIYVVQQNLSCREDLEPRLVGDGRTGDLLRHGGLLELLFILAVDGIGLLADKLGLFDLKFLVGLDFDLASLLHGFLLDERRHLAELIVDLRLHD